MAENEPPVDEKPKPKRGGSKPILKVSGIGRVDNNMKNNLFGAPPAINQKNYYTDYLKKDDQLVSYRQVQAIQPPAKEEGAEDDENVQGSKTIVLHPGSSNLRFGLSTHVYPKSIPNVIAHKYPSSPPHSQDDESPIGVLPEDSYETVSKDFKERMRFYKRRILPNSHEMVANFNSRTSPEEIADHNDPYRVEWTDPAEKPYYVGEAALKIPPNYNYTLKWPIRHGRFNETCYSTQQQLLGDISLILVDALENELEITFKEYKEYNVVLVIPDLYDRSYVTSMIQLILDMGFGNVCILQESIAATFGAGISVGCIVDVGAQKTSISCVEEGMVIPDSRVHLDYGGDDITAALMKILVQKSSFPYASMNLNRQYDWTLANELKQKYSSVNDADIAVQLYSFYQRAPGQQTKKYEFKTFDEVMLAPLGMFYPQLFEMGHKSRNRYKLFPPSYDVYEDNKPNEPISDAQINIQKNTLADKGKSYMPASTLTSSNSTQPDAANSTPNSSLPGTPAPQEDGNNKDGAKNQQQSNVSAAAQAAAAAKNQETIQLKAYQELLESEPASPVVGLDHAIIESVTQAAAKTLTNSTQQNFYDTLMIVGGGIAKIPGINGVLSDRISMWRQAGAENGTSVTTGEVAIMPIPRDMDPSLITWKGGGVFAKLKIVNEMWITPTEWDMIGSRCLHYKAMFLF